MWIVCTTVKFECAGKVLPPQIDTQAASQRASRGSKIDPGCGFHSHRRRHRWEPQINCQTNKLPISQINIKDFVKTEQLLIVDIMILSSYNESGACYAINVCLMLEIDDCRMKTLCFFYLEWVIG